MSRRTSRSALRKPRADSRRPERPAAAGDPTDPQRCCPRADKWLLAAAVLLQAAWIAFLAAMALLG